MAQSRLVREILDETIAFLDTALEIRKQMAPDAASGEHIRSNKRIILKKVSSLCTYIRMVCDGPINPTDLDVVNYLQRMTAIKVQLVSIPEVHLEIDWARFDQAMSAGYEFLEHKSGCLGWGL